MTTPPTDIVEFGPVFDADNHYWETSEAFTRHRKPEFLDRGLRVLEVNGALRYFIRDKPHEILPGPGDVQPRPRPGALYDYFGGRGDKHSIADELACEDPAEHPEWYDRDARLRTMDRQGLDATWLFPSHAVCIEGPMQPDIEAALEVLAAFNRWLEEDWGFAYRDRIFAAPFLSLSDVDRAVAELEWCLARGARVVTIRNGPAFTPEGTRSPADPIFDPFWARAQEAHVVVTVHAGFDDGYRLVDDALARTWGIDTSNRSSGALTVAGGPGDPFVNMMMKHRLVHDFAGVIVAHGLFDRFPELRVAFIENGGLWVGPLLHALQLLHAQNGGMFKTSPVDQFIEHCWVAPFVEETVAELAQHLPTERILFGSDWPHAEGLAEPREFLSGLESFSEADQHRIMFENARDLTFN